MIKKVPIIAARLNFWKIVGLFPKIFLNDDIHGQAREAFAAQLKKKIHQDHLYLVNSGLAGFFIILECLKKMSNRTEVIVPDYTAASLVVAIKKAGLIPVFCDISLDDFNLDVDQLSSCVNENTLCILNVHMFGIINEKANHLKERFPEVFIVDDCCQAFGSRMKDELAGYKSYACFFSFNRGKNMPMDSGGCIATSNAHLNKLVQEYLNGLENLSLGKKLRTWIKACIFAIVTQPVIYGLLYHILYLFKDFSIPKDFGVAKLTELQASLGLVQLDTIFEDCRKRFHHGHQLIRHLVKVPGIKLPRFSSNIQPAYTRFPLMIENAEDIGLIEEYLNANGIEVSRMYGKPLHDFFPEICSDQQFPNAAYFSDRLLTLPVHPKVRESDIDQMAQHIKMAIERSNNDTSS